MISRNYGRDLISSVITILATVSFSAFGERAPGKVVVDIPEVSATVNKAADGAADFSVESHFGAGGEPMLPVQTVQVMLPPSADLSTVKASLGVSKNRSM
jgi:hypothetical protein